MNNICDKDDKAIVTRRFPKWLLPFLRKPLKRFTRGIVERAKERGFINSWSYHEMHAMLERVFA